MREIDEEFGVVIEVSPRIVDVRFCLMGKAYTLIAFFAQHVSGEYQLNRHRQIKWVDVDELTRMNLAPADIPVAVAINRLRRTEGR